MNRADCLICRELCGDVVLPGGFLFEEESVAAFHGGAEEIAELVQPLRGT